MFSKSELDALRRRPDVRVRPAVGLPASTGGVAIPPQVIEFYQQCGGIDFYVDTEYSLSIVSPSDVVAANPVIADIGNDTGDRSDGWLVFGQTSAGDYIIVDSDPTRAGRIYDGFFEGYGLVGDMPKIASSPFALVRRLAADTPEGGAYYWMKAGWESLGDAYD